jgi:ABC-type nitrate/sulfonate/bicarbonate transport system ATPase subunit
MFETLGFKVKLPDFSLKIPEFKLSPARNQNEALFVHAPSGFGKSTLLRAIAGLEPSQGSFTGSDLPVHQREIGFVFQDQLLLSHLNATQNVMLGLELRGMGKNEAKTLAETELTKIGLGSRLEASIQTLSGGERQRVAFLRALLIRPKLLLLDEPFKGLDGESKNRMNEYLRDALRAHPVAVIWVSHENEKGLCLVGVNPGETSNERAFVYTSTSAV